jgi:hypothetical protein
MSDTDKPYQEQPQYTYRCSNCCAECRYDHEGNGCHSCARGVMMRQRKD